MNAPNIRFGCYVFIKWNRRPLITNQERVAGAWLQQGLEPTEPEAMWRTIEESTDDGARAQLLDFPHLCSELIILILRSCCCHRRHDVECAVVAVHSRPDALVLAELQPSVAQHLRVRPLVAMHGVLCWAHMVSKA